MERKTSKKLIICLTLFFVISTALLVSLAFSAKIEKALGMRPEGASTLSKYEFRVDFVDVGQGSACLIELPTDEIVLIDAGTNKSEDALVSYLKKRDVTLIDYFILTHSDNDHTGGADEVYENFEVKNTYRPFILSNNDNYDEANDPLLFYQTELGEDNVTVVTGKDYAECIKLMYEEKYYDKNGNIQNSTVHVASEETVILASTASIKFWWPKVMEGQGEVYHQTIGDKNLTLGKPVEVCSSTNNYSPVMTIDFLSMTMVLTGDSNSTVERDVLEGLSATEKDLFENCDIYVAGHHGSNSSSCEEFLQILMPKYVVVQCGNSDSHPHEKFLARVQSVWTEAGRSGTILRTDQNNNIECYFHSADLVEVEMAVNFSGSGNSVVTHWWQVVVTGIAIAVVLFILPLIPMKKRRR